MCNPKPTAPANNASSPQPKHASYQLSRPIHRRQSNPGDAYEKAHLPHAFTEMQLAQRGKHLKPLSRCWQTPCLRMCVSSSDWAPSLDSVAEGGGAEERRTT